MTIEKGTEVSKFSILSANRTEPHVTLVRHLMPYRSLLRY